MDCSMPGFPVHHQLSEIESVMTSNHLILSHPHFHLPSVFPSIRVFPNESVLGIREPKYWSFSQQVSIWLCGCQRRTTDTAQETTSVTWLSLSLLYVKLQNPTNDPHVPIPLKSHFQLVLLAFLTLVGLLADPELLLKS